MFFKSTKKVYDHILDLRIATPQIVINFGLFLEENKYFEEAFKVSSACLYVAFCCFSVELHSHSIPSLLL